MKVQVVKRFVDRSTKKLQEEGTVCEYDESRAKELIKGGFVKEAREPKVAPVQPEKG